MSPELRSLPALVSAEARALRAEHYGICGATEKRAAGLYFARSAKVESSSVKKTVQAKTNTALKHAQNWYKRAMQTGMQKREHWPATQHLSLSAVLRKAVDPDTFDGTFTWASQDLAGDTEDVIAWAHGTLGGARAAASLSQPC